MEPVVNKLDSALSPENLDKTRKEIREGIEQGVAVGLALFLLSLFGVPNEKESEKKKTTKG